jgi:hypothetical protein
MKLGTWSTPSGNSCDVYLVGQGTFRQLEFRWDRVPLRTHDEVFYQAVILPEAARRAAEYLEVVGPALVVTP